MTTLRRVSTNYEARWHVYVDEDDEVLDCLSVELPPYTLGVPYLLHRVGATVDDLWPEALQVLELLRGLPRQLVLPASVLNPFGVIVVRSFDAVYREAELKREMMLGECDDQQRARLVQFGLAYSRHQHEARVAALGRAVELMGGAPLPDGSCNWPPIRH